MLERPPLGRGVIRLRPAVRPLPRWPLLKSAVAAAAPSMRSSFSEDGLWLSVFMPPFLFDVLLRTDCPRSVSARGRAPRLPGQERGTHERAQDGPARTDAHTPPPYCQLQSAPGPARSRVPLCPVYPVSCPLRVLCLFGARLPSEESRVLSGVLSNQLRLYPRRSSRRWGIRHPGRGSPDHGRPSNSEPRPMFQKSDLQG